VGFLNNKNNESVNGDRGLDSAPDGGKSYVIKLTEAIEDAKGERMLEFEKKFPGYISCWERVEAAIELGGIYEKNKEYFRYYYEILAKKSFYQYDLVNFIVLGIYIQNIYHNMFERESLIDYIEQTGIRQGKPDDNLLSLYHEILNAVTIKHEYTIELSDIIEDVSVCSQLSEVRKQEEKMNIAIREKLNNCICDVSCFDQDKLYAYLKDAYEEYKPVLEKFAETVNKEIENYRRQVNSGKNSLEQMKKYIERKSNIYTPFFVLFENGTLYEGFEPVKTKDEAIREALNAVEESLDSHLEYFYMNDTDPEETELKGGLYFLVSPDVRTVINFFWCTIYSETLDFEMAIDLRKKDLEEKNVVFVKFIKDSYE